MDGRRIVRDVSSGGSFLSVHDPRLHFGLGAAKQAERIVVRWPSGEYQVVTNQPINAMITLVEP